MSVPNNNVIGRLCNLMIEIKEYKSNNPSEVIGKIFQVEPTDKAAVLESYAQLFYMATEGKNRIKQIDMKSHDIYLNALNSAIEALSKINFNNETIGMDTFKKYFDREKLIPLEFCADLLENNSNGRDLNDKEVQSLLEEVSELINQVLEMEINKDLKYICINNLKNIHDAIIKYDLFGSDGLIKNIESSLGSLILNCQKAKSVEERTIVETICNKIKDIGIKLGLLNNSINLIETLTENIKKIDEIIK